MYYIQHLPKSFNKRVGPGGGGDEDILVIRKHNRVIMKLNISCEDREGKKEKQDVHVTSNKKK